MTLRSDSENAQKLAQRWQSHLIRSESPVAPSITPQAETRTLSWRARLLAVPVIGSLARWLWTCLRLHHLAVKADDLARMQKQLQEALRRVGHYEQALRESLLAGLSRDQQGLTYQAQLPESVYVALEERLRGDPGQIAKRQQVYLPRVQIRAAQLQAPVLDVGCGRGEWLQELRLAGVDAQGVDTSQGMLARAVEQGLTVTAQPALPFLLAQEPGSYAVITAFQVVEHIPVPDLCALLQAMFRALKPGGLLILETPNPENLQVAAYTFRFDPTHLQPLPPPLLDVLVRSTGFGNITIERQAPWPQYHEENEDYPPYLRKLLFCEQDYALIADKPSA